MAKGHHDWTQRWRQASIETKINISAQFFSRAYLKYNITADAGSVDQARPPRSASRLTGATVFHRFYILCNAA